MSRYVESTGNFLYRSPISVDLTAGGTTVDVSAVVPGAWPEFWDRILSSGADIRVVSADGLTLCTYDIQGFVYATKTLTIEVDNVDLSAATNKIGLLWLCWGNANAVDAHTAFAPAAAKTGYFAIEVPSDRTVVVEHERQGQTKAGRVLVKQASEVVDVYFDFAQVLRRRPLPYGGSDCYEEIVAITSQDVQLAAVSQGSMFTAASARMVGQTMAKVAVKAGTSGTTYTVICQVTTSLGAVYEGRARLYVQNTSET